MAVSRALMRNPPFRGLARAAGGPWPGGARNRV